MKRLYYQLVQDHFKDMRQMVFLAGPRQVGKTTISLEVGKESGPYFYFNWDNDESRRLIISGSALIAEQAGLLKMSKRKPIIIFDHFGGFPEPYLKAARRFSSNWQRMTQTLMLQEDIRDLSQIQELAQLEMLAELLQETVGQYITQSTLANMVKVSIPTISRWLYHFQEQTGAPHAFQLNFGMKHVNKDCFSYHKPTIVPASTFLSQLV